MKVRELAVSGAYEFSPDVHRDERGAFVAHYTESAFSAAVGHPLRLGQNHHSVSRRGAVRGVHYADVPPGQAKMVTCVSGELIDVVVDLRVGSPTFGRWDSVRLDPVSYRAVYLAEGLGHAFIALRDDTVAAYLNSEEYNPGAEHEIDPFDPALGLPWPRDLEYLVSERDRNAPGLAEAERAGLLPSYEVCRAPHARRG
ncbi:dTDP-4-dehydrorhamnose 3,5-epimerase family protein [Streptomyces rapamycinicus]|uniref:dTDP-4-dehydrorhamnose 3,5-epimerase n=2 Tax=Streptomyces rapamycinicus TaxID=1226757 RepID=A0A0A0N770_STRRN|nr:dTDP-4-dehydrorhamnose 3,5-epimerase [Streptomyces rapamycinicus]AGP52916.1 dTDP-4-dehydrorhamnose 3,5-epimerase [Streptomyces rapamycinicus NRRL 5491]MBB4780394.1 dTDP-4-dehydrorhamnose 3,5-epimerase [Streptomyces rapamycinicus]RLV74952.1 dTDP-4-dehydrorhamnose 3,5-epimerase [Streptomyces rapamycinicus NRRL 5491]UTO61124.1 dTDP-4-dehydrorhamnose 3,5-epimerase [Streptomyces rapamycinicus]UTP29068.1 dTDP-4-dehydrorhamnose 3,5-epimerase [Streptomyces rapamycinicus NRRL 5491]